MRAIAFLGPTLVAIAALGACGGKVFVDAPTGAGGSTTTSSSTVLPNTTVVTSTTTFSGPSTVTSTTDGIDPCSSGADCAQCGDFNTCSQCVENNHPQGFMLYNALVQCIYCISCYNACDGASAGCPNPPTVKDACDIGTGTDACYDPSSNPPGGCIPCGEAGSCQGALQACQQDMDCIAFNNDLQTCPTQ